MTTSDARWRLLGRAFLAWDGRIGRLPYLLVGVTGFVLKFALDSAITRAMGVRFDLGAYWLRRGGWTLEDDSAVGVILPATLFAVAMPFVWLGVLLTVKRLRDASLPLWLAVLFFVPFLNLLFFAMLVMAPERSSASGSVDETDVAVGPRSRTVGEATGSLVLAAAAAALAGLGLVAFSVLVVQSYGLGLFVGSPFVIGLVAAVLHGRRARRSRGACYAASGLALVCAAFLMLALALEGVLCLLMAAPLGVMLALAGAELGFRLQARTPSLASPPALTVLPVLPVLALLIVAESEAGRGANLRRVTTAVEVAAPPEVVWQKVVAFPEMPPPTELLFRAGIAYPVRAEITGHGTSAIRRCVFSTGAFVEPITVWQAPRRLAFDVIESPAPLREATFYAQVHAPHLDGFLVSRRGEFVLEPLAIAESGAEATRLVGSTWYGHDLWPSWYWGLWSDAIIHRVHRRVLRHIAAHAEAAVAPAVQAPASGSG